MRYSSTAGGVYDGLCVGSRLVPTVARVETTM
jgi:hypothetical protein